MPAPGRSPTSTAATSSATWRAPTNVFITEIGRREQRAAQIQGPRRRGAGRAAEDADRPDPGGEARLARPARRRRRARDQHAARHRAHHRDAARRRGQALRRGGGERQAAALRAGALRRAHARRDASSSSATSRRAADLVHSFKQVAADQASGERRQFDMDVWLQDLLTSLGPVLRKTKHEVVIECPPEVTVDTYPGALGQVLTNLLINAVAHAYEQGSAGPPVDPRERAAPGHGADRLRRRRQGHSAGEHRQGLRPVLHHRPQHAAAPASGCTSSTIS